MSAVDVESLEWMKIPSKGSTYSNTESSFLQNIQQQQQALLPSKRYELLQYNILNTKKSFKAHEH